MKASRLPLFLALLALLAGLAGGGSIRTAQAARSEAPRQANPAADLQISGLEIAPLDPRVGETLTISFLLTNSTGSPITVDPMGVGLRGPDACAPANPWEAANPHLGPDGRSVTIDPGTWPVTFETTVPFKTPGVYILEPVYFDSESGGYPAFQGSSPRWFNVTDEWGDMPTPPCLIVSRPLDITPADPHPGATVTASFTVENNSGRTITLSHLKAAGRSGYLWDGGNADFPDAFSSPAYLFPGESYDYIASTIYPEEGEYFAEPWYQEYGAEAWYTGGIWGGNRVFRHVANWSCGSAAPPLYFQGYEWTNDPTLPTRPDWYDRAYGATWATGTIGEWGCNLTSSASIISYYAALRGSTFMTNPEKLNAYLRNTPKGFVGDTGRIVSHDKATLYAQKKGITLSTGGPSGGSDQAAVRYQVCDLGNPVILGVNPDSNGDASHYVLATGMINIDGSETIAINDPVWGHTTLREKYGDYFVSYLGYSPVLKSDMSIYLSLANAARLGPGSAYTGAPADFVITDPAGRRLGYDPNSGISYNEIPDAGYSSGAITPPGSGMTQPSHIEAHIPEPLDGTYSLTVIGKDYSDFNLDAVSTDLQGNVNDKGFSRSITPGETTQIDVAFPIRSSLDVYLPLIAGKPRLQATTSDLRGLTEWPSPWAVGANGVILHYNGSDWVKVPSPTTKTLYGVDMLSETEGWAVGAEGVILHWNGSAWSQVSSPTTKYLSDVDFFGPSNGWAAGEGVILYYNGSSWVQKGTADTWFYDVYTPSPDDGWMVAAFGATARYNGSLWDVIETPLFSGLLAVSSTGPSDAWAVGDSSFGSTALAHWNGYSWSDETVSGFRFNLYDVKMLASNDAWAVGEGGKILYYDGSSWSQQGSPTTASLYALGMSGASSGWAVGAGGVILHFDGSGWTRVQ